MTKRKASLSGFLPLLGIVVVVMILAVATGGKFLSPGNLRIIFNSAYTVAMISVGIVILTSHGGIDLSVGAVLAMCEMLAAMTYTTTGSRFFMILMAVIVGAGCSCLTGLITVKLNMSPFVSSLCMRFACSGIVNSILGSRKIGVASLEVPSVWSRIIILVVCALIIEFLCRFTKLGKGNKAIGENPLAAFTSGVSVPKTRILAYLISGVMIGLAAYFDLLRIGTMLQTTGQGMEMDVIIAIVLGGLSLSGGFKASVSCALVGGFLVVILSNGLQMLGVPSIWIGIVECLIFLAIVPLNYRRDKSGLLPR